MKIKILAPLIVIFIFSCNSKPTKVNLTPNLELIDKEMVTFEGVTFKYSQVDSVLANYKQNVPLNLKDSIRIELVVNVNQVPMRFVSDIKKSFMKNKIMKVTYKPQK